MQVVTLLVFPHPQSLLTNILIHSENIRGRWSSGNRGVLWRKTGGFELFSPTWLYDLGKAKQLSLTFFGLKQGLLQGCGKGALGLGHSRVSSCSEGQHTQHLKWPLCLATTVPFHPSLSRNSHQGNLRPPSCFWDQKAT